MSKSISNHNWKKSLRDFTIFLTFLIRHVCYFLFEKIRFDMNPWFQQMLVERRKLDPKCVLIKACPWTFQLGCSKNVPCWKNNHKVRVYMRENPSWQTVVFILKKYSCTNLSLLLEASSLYNNSIHEKSTISSNLSLKIYQLTNWFGWNQDQNIAFPPQTFFSIQQAGIWYSFAAYNNVVKNSSKLLIRNFCT